MCEMYRFLLWLCVFLGLVVVSDAVAAQGLADGNYRIGPQLVTVEGVHAYVTGTKTLCGSTSALDTCVAMLKQSLGKHDLYH